MRRRYLGMAMVCMAMIAPGVLALAGCKHTGVPGATPESHAVSSRPVVQVQPIGNGG